MYLIIKNFKTAAGHVEIAIQLAVPIRCRWILRLLAGFACKMGQIGRTLVLLRRYPHQIQVVSSKLMDPCLQTDIETGGFCPFPSLRWVTICALTLENNVRTIVASRFSDKCSKSMMRRTWAQNAQSCADARRCCHF